MIGTGSRGAAPHGTARSVCPSAAVRPAASQGTRSFGWEPLSERSCTKLRRGSGRPRLRQRPKLGPFRGVSRPAAARAAPCCSRLRPGLWRSLRAAAVPRGWRWLRDGRAGGGLPASRLSCLPGSGGPCRAPLCLRGIWELAGGLFRIVWRSALQRRNGACARAALAGDVRKEPRRGAPAGGCPWAPGGWRSSGASRSAPRLGNCRLAEAVPQPKPLESGAAASLLRGKVSAKRGREGRRAAGGERGRALRGGGARSRRAVGGFPVRGGPGREAAVGSSRRGRVRLCLPATGCRLCRGMLAAMCIALEI